MKTTQKTPQHVEALEREAAVAAAFRGVPVDDPKRRAALRELLRELVEARDALLPAVRRGRRIGRSVSCDPSVLEHRELRKAIARTRSRLAPTSGTPYRSRTSRGIRTNRSRAAETAAKSLESTLGVHEGHLDAWVDDFAALKRVIGGGEPFAGLKTYRDESRALVARVNAARSRVKQRVADYESAVDALRADAREAYDANNGAYVGLYASYSRHRERLAIAVRRAERFEAAAIPFRAALYRATRRRRPLPRPVEVEQAGRQTRDWRGGAALEAVKAFHAERGRLPTKSELNTLPDLPPYTTIKRAFGPNPMTELDRIVTSDTNMGATDERAQNGR